MTSIEFGKLCQPLNRKYKELFGVVPCPADYQGGQDMFLAMLTRAVEEKRPLETYLSPIERPKYSDGNIKI